MDNWRYLERHVITDPQGRRWTIALMDILGQEGDPDLPNEWQEIQYASGRYFTLIYSGSGAVQRENGHSTLEEATGEYLRLLIGVEDGLIDPAQPVFRENLDD